MNLRTKLAGMGITLLAVVGLAFGAAWMFQSCQPTPPPKIPPVVQKSIDSLQQTKPDFDSTQKAGQAKITGETEVAVAQSRQAAKAVASATSALVLADSLAATATQAKTADSAAKAWKAAYEARTQEADQWHIAAIKSDSAYKAERSARITAVQLKDDALARLAATDRVNEGLKDAIKKLEQPCRIVRPIPCPSRTVTMVISVAAAAAATAAASK